MLEMLVDSLQLSAPSVVTLVTGDHGCLGMGCIWWLIRPVIEAQLFQTLLGWLWQLSSGLAMSSAEGSEPATCYIWPSPSTQSCFLPLPFIVLIPKRKPNTGPTCPVHQPPREPTLKQWLKILKTWCHSPIQEWEYNSFLQSHVHNFFSFWMVPIYHRNNCSLNWFLNLPFSCFTLWLSPPFFNPTS